MDAVTRLGTQRVEARRDGTGWLVGVNGRVVHVDAVRNGPLWSFLLAPPAADPRTSRRSHLVGVEERRAGKVVVHVDGRPVSVTLPAPQGRASRQPGLRADGSGPEQVIAPMPGRVIKMLVKPGDRVAPRQPVVIIEAMKMQNELRALRAGTVSDVCVTEGVLVDAGAPLVVILPRVEPAI